MAQMQPQRNDALRNGDTGAPGPVLLGRPLGARSVMASLLLGMDPPRIRGPLLVRWCGRFGIAEGTARVALSRMVAGGELTAANGSYELAGALRNRHREQDWSLSPQLRRWRGGWRMAAVDPVARSPSERHALRDAMQHLRCAELREGLWIRPDNLPAAADPTAARSVADAQCSWWTGRPAADPGVLAERLFSPTTWAARATGLTARLVDVTGRLGRLDAGLETDAFLAGAEALVHVRADPLLPESLLPSSRSGAELRAAYGAYRAAFADATARWFRRNRE